MYSIEWSANQIGRGSLRSFARAEFISVTLLKASIFQARHNVKGSKTHLRHTMRTWALGRRDVIQDFGQIPGRDGPWRTGKETYHRTEATSHAF